MSHDISPDFKGPNRMDSQVLERLLRYEGQPRAIRVFSNECHKLSDYAYWHALGTLFSSARPNRDSSLMKPSELRVWKVLPPTLTVYRAHRPGETDWLSYTLSAEKAAWFAWKRGVDQFTEYSLPWSAAICLFLRRGEFEVLALDPASATSLRTIGVVAPAATAPVGSGL